VIVLRIAIAENGKGKHYIDFEKDAPHYLIAGATGMGKSVLLRGILTTLTLRDNCPDLYLTDLKGGIELGLFRDLIMTKRFATCLDSLSNLLYDLIKEMDRRYEVMFSESRVAYNGKRVLFILDEMIDLYKTTGDPKAKLKSRIKGQLAELTAKGRAAGITVILCTQRPDVQIIDGIIKTNINNKICFKVVDGTQSEIVLGRGNNMAAYLPEISGRCLMFMNTKKDIAQVYYLDYERAKGLLEGVVRKRVDDKRAEVVEVNGDTTEFRPVGVSNH
jgi:DNA segregation ATPase FtsK/SpoIIIE-like protein